MRSFLLLAALAGSAFSAEAGRGHHAAPMAAPLAELGADAGFDRQGVLWVVHKVSGHLAVSRSEDRGRTWSSPVLVTPAPEPTDAGGDARPKIALGPQDEIYVTWTKPLAKPYTGEVKFSRSLDGGRTFSAPIVVHHDRQEITHRFDALAVNGRGQLFVAWIDKRDGVAAAKGGSGPYRGAAVYFAVSDDRGATFRGDFKVADHSCECCRIALVPEADGGVTAMWRHVFAPNIRDHAVAALRADGTAGEVRRATFDDWRLDACPHHGPGLGQDADGRWHAVWFSAAPGRTGVFYGRLGAAGVEDRRRVGADGAEHADLAVAGRRIGIAWKEFDGTRTWLRGLTSDDAGATWRDHALAATAGPSGHPRVFAFDGRLYALWHTRTEPLTVIPLP